MRKQSDGFGGKYLTMIKQVRSWSKDSSIPNLIGKKKVDWSIFENGSHIPSEFHIDFVEANGGEKIPVGESRKVTLLVGNENYEATLFHLDQKSNDRTAIHLRYDGNRTLKSFLAEVFKHSYEFLQKERSAFSDPEKRVQVKVPDEQAEYIEFYSTGVPYRYELRFLPFRPSNRVPQVWWVNQGSTIAIEQNEGILWAPMRTISGGKQYHWDSMDEVREGDIILHYANGALRFVSQVKQAAVPSRKPESLGGSNTWEEEGRLVRSKYYPLEPEIPLQQFNLPVMDLQIKKGPIHSGGGVNQGYLFYFTPEALKIIQKNSKRTVWPAFTILSEDSNEQEQPPVPELTVSERLQVVKSYIRQKGFAYPDHLIENFYLSLKSKPFVILAGVSGTGKTKLVKLFAEALGATSENGQFTLIPVRPEWSDPSDLLGYKDLNQTFRPGPLTEVLTEAAKPTNQHKPYFICLDEMNLARVEHYFSDILSVLETQVRRGDRIVTDPLIRASALIREEDQQRYGNLYLPDNVYLIGTVNMDETTHPFSKKVLDRANTIEFNYINLDQFPSSQVTSGGTEPVATPNAFLRSDYLQLVDVYHGEYKELIEQTTEKLVQVNDILETIHSHVGFRIRDAICFYLIYNQQAQLLTQEAAFDLQLLQKILPRIQGSNASVRRVLLQLLEIALGKKLNKSELEEDASELWKDTAKTVESAVYPQSAKKIVFMLRRLDEDGFTSYWLS
jgi:5-methylcytosine-specific restriction protein B